MTMRANNRARKCNPAIASGIALMLVLAVFLVPSLRPASAQEASSYALRVNAVSLDGTVRHMWATIQSASGATVQTGFTPLTYAGNAGVTYSVTVSDYQDRIFDHWENGSTSRTRTITLSADTTITAYYRTGTVTSHSLKVNAVSMASGAALNMWTTIQSGSTVVQTGFTPLSFTGSSSTTYSVSVQDYQNLFFDHWENGSTGRTRTITLNSDTTITAYYRTGSSVSLTVNSALTSGGSLTGMYTTITSGGTTVAAGFTPLKYTATAGTTYTVVPQDYGSYTFSHWENGSTTRSRTVTPTSSTALTAYYSAIVVPLNVNTVDLTGKALEDVYTVIESGSTVVAVGNTPLSYNAISGITYVVTPSDHEVFADARYEFHHWSDGSTARSKTITPTSSTTLTAYYKSRAGNASTVSVHSVSLSGAEIPGIYTTISPATSTITSGYTPRTYTLYPDTAYTVSPKDYGSYVFDHWGNGSTNRDRTFTPTSPMYLIAYFRTVPSVGDATLPSVTILSPAAGMVLTNTSPTISGTASDNIGVTKIQISVDGGPYRTAEGLTRWSFSMTGLSNGSHSATVRASDNAGNTQTATVSFSVASHPILYKTGVYIPLYFPPSDEYLALYDRIAAAKLAHPSVPIVAAINPASGPGSSLDSNYHDAVHKLRAAGIVVVGYVPTKYGARDINAVTADIDKYISWYHVDGIHLDEFANNAGYEDYYRELTAYAKSHGLRLVMGNAGADVPESYIGTVDTIGITEEDGYNPVEWLKYCAGCTDSGWHYKHDKNSFWFVRYAVGTLDETYVSEAAKWTGLMYMTNGVSPTRWDGIPPYFEDLVAKLDV